MSEEQNKYMYRYADIVFRDSIAIQLLQFKIIKYTKCGKWINHYGINKFVLNGARKRFAYETKELALQSFIMRKSRQCIIYKARLVDAEKAYEIAKHMQDTNNLGTVHEYDLITLVDEELC